MPLVHISMIAGKPAAYRSAVFDSLYRAMHEVFAVPADDQFMAITEHDALSLRFSPTYLGVSRSADVMFIQITANNTRTLDQKRALYRRIAELLAQSPGVRAEDVFISLVEVPKENWSLGMGIAQYAE